MTTTPQADLPAGVAQAGQLSQEELALALRNHGMPLEALRYPLTPAGLHYLLIHFDIPALDAATWSVTIDGLVGAPMTLTLDDLRARPAVTVPVTLECAGNGRALLDPRPISQPWLHEAVGTAEWTGTPLGAVLEEAGVGRDAVEVLFTGHDRGVQGDVEHDYQRSLPVAEAMRPEVLLAYEMNGQPLLPQHGHPVRLVVPGWYGMTHVKWLRSITLIDEPFTGYQQTHTYWYKQSEDDPGRPVTRVAVKSLMVPPGIPDFLTRRRVVDAGLVELSGRAWSGDAPVTGVDVTVDGGATWHAATLGEPLGPYAWAPWTWAWHARPGTYRLGSRATDASGARQPVDQPWNLQGMANNGVHWVDATVR